MCVCVPRQGLAVLECSVANPECYKLKKNEFEEGMTIRKLLFKSIVAVLCVQNNPLVWFKLRMSPLGKES